jgi:hypothetical protein
LRVLSSAPFRQIAGHLRTGLIETETRTAVLKIFREHFRGDRHFKFEACCDLTYLLNVPYIAPVLKRMFALRDSLQPSDWLYLPSPIDLSIKVLDNHLTMLATIGCASTHRYRVTVTRTEGLSGSLHPDVRNQTSRIYPSSELDATFRIRKCVLKLFHCQKFPPDMG